MTDTSNSRNTSMSVDELRDKVRDVSRQLVVKQQGGTISTFTDAVVDALMSLIEQYALNKQVVTGDTSDGYHTFNELYDYRRAYNAALFNEWAAQGKYDVHKSWKHSDGEKCFGGGWFIVMAELPTGQISNHYESQYWDDFNLPVYGMANEYDGHTPQEALDRITELERQLKTEGDE